MFIGYFSWFCLEEAFTQAWKILPKVGISVPLAMCWHRWVFHQWWTEHLPADLYYGMTSWLPSSSCPSQLQVRSSYSIYCFYPRLNCCSLLSLKTARTCETGLVLTLLPGLGWVCRLSHSFGASGVDRLLYVFHVSLMEEEECCLSTRTSRMKPVLTSEQLFGFVTLIQVLGKMVLELITAKLWHSSSFHFVNHTQGRASHA